MNKNSHISPDLLKARAINSLEQSVPQIANHMLPNCGDHILNPDYIPENNPTPAGVLVPIIETVNGLSILLMQRTDKVSTHAGQISFPGGKYEKTDKDLLETAIRETEEEIGITNDYIEVLGYLDDYQTATGFRIVPVVALIKSGYSITPDDFEVADVFHVPLSFLMSSHNHQKKSKIWRGKERFFYAIPYNDRYIWGATAGIIRNLYERLFDE